MFDQRALRDELQSLKADLSNRLHTTGEDIYQGSRARVDPIAEQIKGALHEIGEVLSHEDVQLHKLVAERPVAALATAFALGVVVGIVLRRH